MPSGAIHARDSRVLAILTPIPVAVLTANLVPAALVAVGCLSGIPLSPDLDHHNRTYAERLPVIGKLWEWFWLPYEKLMPHRSYLSHAPILGTLLRQLYLITILWGVAYLAGWESMGLGDELLWLSRQTWYQWWLLGLVLSDLVHWFQDVRPKWKQRRRPRRWSMWDLDE